jgi:hypothetical protein
LRAADPDQLGLVELDQRGAVSAHRGLAGHQHPVVGLDLVADHADLVALPVVDVQVQHVPLHERVEVVHRVVDVDGDLEVAVLVQIHQVRKRRGEHAAQPRAREQFGVGLLVPRDDHDRMPGVEQFEHRQPLSELVELARVVGEVDGDLAGHAGARVVAGRLRTPRGVQQPVVLGGPSAEPAHAAAP